MSEPGGHWSPRYRLVLITIMLLVVLAVTTVSTLLVADVDEPWTAGSVARAVLVAVLALFSGICVNFLPAAVLRVWRQQGVTDLPLRAVIGKVVEGLKRPLKQAGIVLVVAAIVAVGLALRPPEVGLEPGRLVIMTAFNESADDPRTILIKQWNQTHPENPVHIDFASGEPDQQNARMVNDAKPGGPGLADVYVLDVVWMAQFAEFGYIREFERSASAELGDFLPKVLGTCAYREKLWGLPLNTDAGMLYYRTDVAGAIRPKTWKDYYGPPAAAAAAAAVPGVEAANAAQLDDEEILTITALEAMWAEGGEAFGKDGQVALNEDGTAVEFGAGDLAGIRNLAAAYHDPGIVLTGEARSTTDDDAVRTFIDGRTLYMRNWPVARDRLIGEVEFEVAAAPSPSVLGGQNLAVSASTDKPRAARALIEFLTSPSSQLILSEIGGFAPTRQSAYDNARRDDIQELRTAVDDARLRPITPHYVEFSRVFREGIAEALDTGQSAELPPDLRSALAKILNR